jgi:hypothetical protein
MSGDHDNKILENIGYLLILVINNIVKDKTLAHDNSI